MKEFNGQILLSSTWRPYGSRFSFTFFIHKVKSSGELSIRPAPSSTYRLADMTLAMSSWLLYSVFLRIENTVIFASCTHNDPPVGIPSFCFYQLSSKTPTEDSKLNSTSSTNQATKVEDQSGLHSFAASLSASITNSWFRLS